MRGSWWVEVPLNSSTFTQPLGIFDDLAEVDLLKPFRQSLVCLGERSLVVRCYRYGGSPDVDKSADGVNHVGGLHSACWFEVHSPSGHTCQNEHPNFLSGFCSAHFELEGSGVIDAGVSESSQVLTESRDWQS